MIILRNKKFSRDIKADGKYGTISPNDPSFRSAMIANDFMHQKTGKQALFIFGYDTKKAGKGGKIAKGHADVKEIDNAFHKDGPIVESDEKIIKDSSAYAKKKGAKRGAISGAVAGAALGALPGIAANNKAGAAIGAATTAAVAGYANSKRLGKKYEKQGKETLTDVLGRRKQASEDFNKWLAKEKKKEAKNGNSKK